MAKIRLTKRTVDALPPSERTTFDLYTDTDLPGFGLKVFPSGTKKYFYEYGEHGKRRRMTLGAHGPLTPDQARKIAKDRMAAVVQGRDPIEERRARREMPTFGSWVDTYLEEAARRKKSVRDDRSYLGQARKRWGSRPLDQLTADDVHKMMQQMSKGHPIRGNRWLASVRACLAAAWRLDLVEANPAMKVKLNRENPPRARVLSEDEMQRVLAAIDHLEDPFARTGLLLLILTGARASEVLRAQWADIDLDDATWRIPSPKAGHPQVVPLHTEAVSLLRDLPRLGPYLLPGRDKERHRVDLKRPWAAVLKGAEVEDVHLHDLRRTFGLQVARTAGLHVASKLLRHADVRVTERVYAPLGLDDLRAGLEKAAEARGNVVPLRKKQRG